MHDYFDAINAHNFRKAWGLSDDPGDPTQFKKFVAGYSDTLHDNVKILAVQGDLVTIRLIAEQTDGTRKVFQGTYTVSQGHIVSSNIRQTS